jgi:hypothetical protein
MPKRVRVPDLKLADETVAPKIIQAAHEASKWLTEHKVRHALIGGLAVAAYGYPRATKDVDFLVGEEAFVHHGTIVSYLPGFPLQAAGNVSVDAFSDDAVEDDLDELVETSGIPIVDPETLVYLKLKAFRRRDQEDVIELLRAGLIDQEDSIREYLEDVAPELMKRFEELLLVAEEE